jgi:hypothetical protein
MVKKILFIGAIVALALSGIASATSATTQGVHGAADTDAFGGLVNYKLVVNAERVPTGSLFGNISFVVSEGETIDEAMLDAQPIRLEIAGDTACVVAHVTSFSGDWGYTPVLIAVVIRDVAGGPDIFGVLITLREESPFDLCTFVPTIPIDVGNFTITGGG